MKLSRIDIIGQNGNDGLHYADKECLLNNPNDPNKDYVSFIQPNLEFFIAACEWKRKKETEEKKEFCQNFGRCNCTDGWNCK